ncbi:MAG: hypothetical protein B7Z37_10490, partial [Verrucomicrobia bacterium 12-59-8]
ELAGANRTITTSGQSPMDLILGSVIQNIMGGTASAAGIIKAGTGSLVLTAANTFNGGVQLNAGTLILNASSSLTAAGVPLIQGSTGPLGIGTLTIADGTTLQSGTAVQTISNNVTVNGDFTFGGPLAVNGMILNGAVNLGSSTRTITVISPQNVSTLGGAVSGAAGLSKAGNGILKLSNSGNSYTGSTTVSAGLLQMGGANALPVAGAVFVSSSSAFDIASQATTIGSLTGAGLVTSSGTSVLTVGNGATGSYQFDGVMTQVTSFGLTKIGSGTLTLTNVNTATGNLILNQGGVTLNGVTGMISFATDTVAAGGTLSIDNTTSNLTNRLGGKALTIQGGTVILNGTNAASTNSLETVSTLTVSNGGGTLTLTGGTGGTTTLTATALAVETATSGGSLLIQGLSTTTGAGFANMTTGSAFGSTAGATITGVTQGGGSNGASTMTIRADIIADTGTGTGMGFLTKDTGTGSYLRPLGSGAGAATELATTLTSSLTTNFGNFSSSQTYSTATSINSLTLNTGSAINTTGGGQAIQGAVLQNYSSSAVLNLLTINTGGILDTFVGTNTINAGSITTSANVQFEIHVTGTSVLNLNAFLLGTTGGLVKADGGTLSLNNAEYYAGPTTVNGGVLKLNSGLANTLLVTPTATVAILQNLVVNAGTLDLNGKDQAVAGLSNNDAVGGTGGSIISATTANLFTTSNGTTFGGVIGGGDSNNAINLYKAGTGALTLTSVNTYTGTTNVQGGSLVLQDSGSLVSAAFNVSGATLSLVNNGLSASNTRISSSAAITLNSGTINLTGSNQSSTAETIGTGTGVSLNQGLNTITVTAPLAATSNTAALTIDNLTRTAGVGTAAVFSGTTLGQSLPGSAQIFVNNVNGSTLSSGLLGGWATVGATAATANDWATNVTAQNLTGTVSTTFNSNTVTLSSGSTVNMIIGQQITGTAIPAGSYITGITSATVFTISQNASATNTTGNATLTAAGIAALNSAAYTIISSIGAQSTTIASGNYQFSGLTSAITLAAGGNTVNSLQLTGAAAGVQILDLGAGILTVTSGGVMRTSTGTTGTTTLQNGTLTAGANNGTVAELDIYSNSTAAITLATGLAITDKGTYSAGVSGNRVTLVKSGTAGLTITSVSNNTYTGGTVVNAGTLTLSNASANGTSNVSISAGAGTNGSSTITGYSLVINNGGTVTETIANQIAQTASVLINGGGTLTMFGTNTLSSLTFNDNGGTATPTVATATLLNLSAANAINVTNDNLASTPTISGTALTLTHAAPVITVNGLSTEGLIISAPLTTTGGGTIKKRGAGSLVFSGSVANVLTGGLNIEEGSVIFDNTAATTPYGAGTITIGTGTTILAGTAARTISNATSVSGDFTFGGTLSTNNLTLSGIMTLAAGAHTITVTSPQVTDTISGQITGGTNLIKAGAGSLILSSAANNYGGSTTVSGGVLQLGLAAVIPDASALIVAAGAAFDLNAKAETLGSLAGDTNTTGGIITNSVTGTSATLTIGADNTSTTFAGILTDTKAGVATTGNLLLTKTGTGLQTLTGANTYSGATTIGGTAGGLQVQNTSSSTSFATLGNTAITVGSGVSLMATVASEAPTTVINVGSTDVTTEGASVILGAGSKLDMRDNALGTFNIIEGVTFGLTGLTAAATANLYFDIGSVAAASGVYGGADKITVIKNASITSGAVINLNAVSGATGITTGIIPLITAGGGFLGTGTNNFTLANPALTLSGSWGSKTYNLTLSGEQDTTTQTALSVSVVAPTTAYWSGALDGNWSTNNAGGVTNWRTDATSNVDTQATPDATTNVFFNTTTPEASFLTTSNLITATSIASLTFTSAATGAVTLGNNGSNANTLTIGAGGITHSSSAGTAALNVSVILGASQTWTNDSTNPLSVNGSTITGAGMNLTVAGSGDTALAAAVQTVGGGVTKQDAGQLLFTAINTYSGATLVTGGNLQVGSGGVGSATSSAVTVSGTGSTATTVSAVSGSALTSSSVLSVTQLAAPTLSGTGSVGAVTLGSLSTVGVLRPGDAGGTSPGTLTLNGALTVYSGSQIQLGITSSSNNASTLDSGWDSSVTAVAYLGIHAKAGTASTPDSIYTQWNTVNGTYNSLSFAGQTLSLGASDGGTPTILVQTAGTPSLARGDIFKLMDWSSISSGSADSIGTPFGDSVFTTANDLLLPDLGFGLNWDTSAFSSYGILVIVPEPGRMVLMLFGLAALFLRRRCAGRLNRGRAQRQA